MDLTGLRNWAESGVWVPYAIKSFALDKARTDELCTVEGEFVHAYTDGSLTGIGVRFNQKSNDLCHFDRHNPIYRSGAWFWKLYISNGAQAGKTLDLLIGRDGLKCRKP